MRRLIFAKLRPVVMGRKSGCLSYDAEVEAGVARLWEVVGGRRDLAPRLVQ
jgi:hypothetical protein